MRPHNKRIFQPYFQSSRDIEEAGLYNEEQRARVNERQSDYGGKNDDHDARRAPRPCPSALIIGVVRYQLLFHPLSLTASRTQGTVPLTLPPSRAQCAQRTKNTTEAQRLANPAIPVYAANSIK